MTLSEKFNANATPETQERGHALLEAGACAITAASPDQVTAEVRDGLNLHEATWKILQRRLIPACECRDFNRAHQLCPHLWAALLAAERQGDLSNALKRNVGHRILIPQNATPADGSQDMTYQSLDSRKRRTRPNLIPIPHDGVTYDPRDAQAASRFAPDRRIRHAIAAAADAPQAATVLYIINPQRQQPDALTLNLAWRPTTPPGTPPPPAKALKVNPNEPAPSRLLAKLLAWQRAAFQPGSVTLPLTRIRDFLDLLDSQNVLRILDPAQFPPQIRPVRAVDAPGLALTYAFAPNPNATFTLTATLELPQRTIPLQDALFLWLDGTLLTRHDLVTLDLHGQFQLAHSLLGTPGRVLNQSAARSCARTLLLEGAASPSQLPTLLTPERSEPQAQPKLYVKTAAYKFQGREQLHADLSFNYGDTIVDYADKRPEIPSETKFSIIRRNMPAEQAAAALLESLNVRWNDNPKNEEVGWKLLPADLDALVRTLVSQDWLITAQGKTFRKPTTKTAAIVSRIDWFELEGKVDFDGFQVPLPELLKAKQKGQKAVRLDDGTFGLLPLEWLENFTALTELGDMASDRIKFKLQQAALVAAFAQDARLKFDQTFAERLKTLHEPALQPMEPPPPFHATLRPYQQMGLAWLLHMNRSGLGACLADDMGLGKTIQILSLVQTRHAQGVRLPTLVVMPKSLIFNWEDEKDKFCPHLTSIAYTGPARHRLLGDIPRFNLVFTTYGTLRNDAIELAKIHFDYCILDESQAIKNQDSSTAEAARAIHADYRIAMTGTPIENKLAELFSQLEFLNPGLMGKLILRQDLDASRLSRNTYAKLRQAVKCLILRRTKEQVTPNLPKKTEQVLWCDMNAQQQAEYDALREHLLKKLNDTEDNPDATVTFDALAALLKLRQAACHPGLAFANRLMDDSPKTDTLLQCLGNLVPQHHKILVFSQFTSFLHIVADRLRQNAIPFLYLDGQTSDRQEVVRQFQENPDLPVFLISLKAGGVGLNLTAADYIFILDPWWNPATEAQAIDRAYRIGQTKPVFAYKLIARNTIEEKVQQLQESKRKLAKSILRGRNLRPQTLTQDDINFLLS